MDLPIAPASTLDATSPPITLFQPEQQTVPLVFVSAHSGRDYPAEFVAAAGLDALTLRRSEDGFVDELFAAAPSFGAPLLTATFARAFCDANREPWELDPGMFEERLPPWVNTTSPRVGAGLGMIARVVASGEAIYRHKLRFAEAQRRVQLYWEPFHAALRDLVEATRRQFGVCLLVDCHSMPGTCAAPNPPADFVLGDAHGAACAAAVTRRAEQELTDLRYRVRRNDPYAGGYITRHYGRPRERVHALQIEVCRSLYMDETRITKLPAFDGMRCDITALVSVLAGLGLALAAG
jgi:N-formylglutamate deformylase